MCRAWIESVESMPAVHCGQHRVGRVSGWKVVDEESGWRNVRGRKGKGESREQEWRHQHQHSDPHIPIHQPVCPPRPQFLDLHLSPPPSMCNNNNTAAPQPLALAVTRKHPALSLRFVHYRASRGGLVHVPHLTNPPPVTIPRPFLVQCGGSWLDRQSDVSVSSRSPQGHQRPARSSRHRSKTDAS